jgi:hypothetical protein
VRVRGVFSQCSHSCHLHFTIQALEFDNVVCGSPPSVRFWVASCQIPISSAPDGRLLRRLRGNWLAGARQLCGSGTESIVVRQLFANLVHSRNCSAMRRHQSHYGTRISSTITNSGYGRKAIPRICCVLVGCEWLHHSHYYGSSGPPVLLLHGYPQTYVIWHKNRAGISLGIVAPRGITSMLLTSSTPRDDRKNPLHYRITSRLKIRPRLGHFLVRQERVFSAIHESIELDRIARDPA